MKKECCKNCKYITVDNMGLSNIYDCSKNNNEIIFPYFMGGSKKCECYERREKIKFQYPKKEKSEERK